MTSWPQTQQHGRPDAPLSSWIRDATLQHSTEVVLIMDLVAAMSGAVTLCTGMVHKQDRCATRLPACHGRQHRVAVVKVPTVVHVVMTTISLSKR